MLTITHLHKAFRGHDGEPVKAIDDISFTVEEGQLFTLLGPSGCGKTTTLRSIAGLERPDSGEITIAGAPVYSSQLGVVVPVHARDIGMVFQSYAIWPHMSVFRNVAFPLKVARERMSRAEMERRVMEALRLVQLDELAGRDATKLSGGQQQRLSLARALVRRPSLLLLDEPLSNLDAKLREQMRFELKRLQREVGVTSLYVTHDQFEALALSDRIAVMRKGRIQQIGSPREIYEAPANEFVATFIGSTNMLSGDVTATARGELSGRTVETPMGSLHCGVGALDEEMSKAVVAIRQEHVAISSARPAAADNVFEAKVVESAYLGECRDYVLDCQGQLVRARTVSDSVFPDESSVWIELPPDRCVVLSCDEDAPRRRGSSPEKDPGETAVQEAE